MLKGCLPAALTMIASFHGLAPLQSGQQPPHIGPAGLRLRLAQRHQRDAVLHHLLYGAVLCKLPIYPAPLAVFFIKRTVRLPCQVIVTQRHSAALTHQRSGAAKQGVNGNSEQPGQCQSSVSASGTVSPRSQRLTACRVTNIFSATSFWDNSAFSVNL